jgi:CRP-like cAMP-binding protein
MEANDQQKYLPLIHTIDAILPLTLEEKDHIRAAFKEKTLKKNTYWVKAGQYAEHIGFITRGKMRVFYETEDGNEITCFFSPENSFIASYTSLLTHTPTHENIMALEATTLFTIHRDELERLSAQIPKMQVLRRIIAENLFIVMEKRIMSLQSETAFERYESMLHNTPELLNTVPLQYLASFLGITPQHMSRLRKKQLK